VDAVFLDANILFSAARDRTSRLRRLWDLANVRLVTSEYAVNEVRRHLANPEQRRALDELLTAVRIVETRGGWTAPPPAAAALPEKDRPILRGAIEAGATHLLTGDNKHFGPFFGQRIEGVLVLPPAEYLASWPVAHGEDEPDAT
jgi:predicted nucleic acid-binding protein